MITAAAAAGCVFYGTLYGSSARPSNPLPDPFASPGPKSPASDPLEGFRKLYNDGKIADSFKLLEKLYNAEKDTDVRAKMSLGLGIVAYQQNDVQKAAQYLNGALQYKTRLDDYAQYYLGLIEKDQKNWNGARQHFEAVRGHLPSSIREADAEIALVQIAKDHGKWSEAYQLLGHLERRHKGDPQYQEILYEFIEAAFAVHRGNEACRAAVRLYSHFPVFTLAKGWGMDLQKSKIGDNVLRCGVGVKERERRIQQLLIAGEFEEIRTELKDWTNILRAGGGAHPEETGHIEQQYGQLALTEGKIKDAISHLLSSQDMMGRNFTTQSLLAKAYSQTDDYPSAVEGYMKAFELSPHSKLGQKALFQAAFLSYQYRDYDGASRRFEMVTRKARGAVVLDAKWHLAWIRYLKSDYDGAEKAFAELSKNRHYARTADFEKLQYWRAMSEYRDGNVEMARAIFTELTASKRMGYYTGAAIARLAELPPPAQSVPPSPVATAIPATLTANPPGASISANPNSGAVPQPETTTAAAATAKSTPVASATPIDAVSRKPSSTEQSLGGAHDLEKEDKDEAKEENDDEESLTPLTEGPNELPPGPSITSLKNPSLVARFERAEDLVDLGFTQWAGLELREIERRTSNRGYLQALMGEYLKAGDFYRSAYIADVIFEAQREKAGIDGATMLWGFAFPEAFGKSVNSACHKFDIAPSLVWSVMRGESGFRQDIHSTAGAMGLMQLIPPTARNVAKEVGLSDFKNNMLMIPDTNILLGTRYLRRLSKVMQGSTPLVIASYNAGPHRVQGWLKDFGDLDMDEFVEHIPYMETRNYVKKVLRNYFVYQNLYEKKTNPLKWLAQKVTVKFAGPKPSSESWDD